MELTVQEFIRIPPMRDSRIIAGRNGSRNLIKQLSMLDGFSGYTYLKANTLAISSGYFLSLEPEEIIPFLQNLSQQGVAGVTLKGKYFRDQIPPAVLLAADRLNFPVILLAPDVKFSELFDFFYSHIYCYRTGAFLLREQVTSFLLSAMYRSGLDGFAKQLFAWTGKAVFITLQHSIFYFPKENPPALFAGLSAYEAKNHCTPLPEHRDLYGFQTQTAFGLGVMFQYKKSQHAMIWLEEPNQKYNANDLALLSAAKTACETGVMQVAAFEQDSLQCKERFVDGLLSGKLDTMSAAVSMAQRLSWFIPQILRVILLDNPEDPALCQEQKRFLEAFFEEEGLNFILSPYRQQLILLLPGEGIECRSFVQKIFMYCKQKQNAGAFRIAVGDVVPFHQTARSYQQASLALKVSEWIHPEQRLIYYDDLGIFKLHGIAELDADIASLCEKYVKPLIDYEATSHVNLIETLFIFFHNKQNFSKTGEQLFIHANTVRYRIELVEKLCQICFSNYHDVLNLQFSLAFLPFVYRNYPLNRELFADCVEPGVPVQEEGGGKES